MFRIVSTPTIENNAAIFSTLYFVSVRYLENQAFHLFLKYLFPAILFFQSTRNAIFKESKMSYILYSDQYSLGKKSISNSKRSIAC